MFPVDRDDKTEHVSVVYVRHGRCHHNSFEFDLMMDEDSAGSDEEAMAVEAAEKACVRATGEKKQFYIDVVMATGDLELAEDSFYN